MRRRTFLRSTIAAAVATSIPGRRSLAALYWPVAQVPPDVDAITGDGREVTLKGKAVQELAASLKGRLLLADDAGYDDARRVLNASIDKHPALIVQATGAADVASAVDFARDNSLLVAVKCGGHSPSGKSTCDRGMMIDLSPFQGVRVDPVDRRARVAGGTLLGLLDHEAMSYGLITPMGTVSHTGVSGLTLGGGFGRVARRFGLSLDNVTAVDVVAADGKLYRASKDENEDLYWGVRGGGGNFGVVTSFEFQLHPMQRQVVGGRIMFPIAKARDVLQLYADYSPEAPDELYLDYLMMYPPGGADGMAGFSVCYSGPGSGATRALEPIRKLGTPAMDGVRAMDYVALQRSGDVDDPRATGSYLKGGFVTEIAPDLATAIVENFEPHPARSTILFFQHGGGAIGRVAPDATSFSQRNVLCNMLMVVGWNAGDDSTVHVDWIRKSWAELEPFTQGFYTNEVGQETAEEIDANYRQNHARLVRVKNRYDPTNLFRLNANVQPTV